MDRENPRRVNGEGFGANLAGDTQSSIEPAAAPQPLGEQIDRLAMDGQITAEQIKAVLHSALCALDEGPAPDRETVGRVYSLVTVALDLAKSVGDVIEMVEIAAGSIRRAERLA